MEEVLLMYQAVPDKQVSWQNRQPSWFALLSYLMGSALKLEKKTLKELFRIHFPDSVLTNDSDDGQGQQN
jgi:hypothetical protein